jgi:hypothetical protein
MEQKIKEELDKLYQSAFDLKNAQRYPEGIAEFKRIAEEQGDPAKVAHLMIALLYEHELNDSVAALPYARKAVELKPESQLASLCLVHCLSDFGEDEELRSEIKRYVSTGGKLDLYQALFEENGLTADDFK